MYNRRNIKFKLLINTRSILSMVIIGILLISSFFSYSIEIFLKIKPDLSFVDDSQFELHVIDVGQGNCQAVSFSNGKNLIVDSGDSSSWKHLKKYLDEVFLQDKKIIDYLILTHTDADHIGNILNILINYEVKSLYIPLNMFNSNQVEIPLLEKLNSINSENIHYNIAGEILEISSSNTIKWLSPLEMNYDDENDYSPILLIESENNKYMITGDATSQFGEIQAINNEIVEDIDVDVLVLGHHGSKYSTSSQFLSYVMPENVCISVGENSYGHPANEVLMRLIEYDNLYHKSTYSNIKMTIVDHNIVYCEHLNQINVQTIDNIDSYGFFDWWLVVVLVSIPLVITSFVHLTFKRKL